MKIRAPKTRSALAVLGAYWSLTSDKAAIHPRLRRQGVRFVCDEIPEGLPPDEAFGLTLAIRWEEQEHAAEDMRQQIAEARADGRHREADALQDQLAAQKPLVSVAGDGWLVGLPGEDARELSTGGAVNLTRALLEVRRKVRPCPRPFAPRDPVAELLQLHLRTMEARLRPPSPVVTIHPPLIESDLGRDWRGGYTCHG